jgi:hypothetical protein
VRPSMLERGARLDERGEGVGLGLAIVQDVLEAYDWALRLEKSQLGGLKATCGGCGRNCRRSACANTSRSARRARREPPCGSSRSPTSPSTGRDSHGRHWLDATPIHGRGRYPRRARHKSRVR